MPRECDRPDLSPTRARRLVGPDVWVQPTYEVEGADLLEIWWVSEAEARGFRDSRREEWLTSSQDGLDELPPRVRVERRTRLPRAVAIAGSFDEAVFLFVLAGTKAMLRVASAARTETDSAVAFFRDLFPTHGPDEPSRKLPITIWHRASYGGDDRRREIEVPAWEEISTNYSVETRDHLAALMKDSQPGEGGQLVLWHGAPGTGKTFALRALGWEWRAWCDLHYVLDPEALFSDPGYLLEVALDAGDEEKVDSRWRLLVLEDTGELLGLDAKTQVGQALSRVLNLVDGMLGQSLRLLVLITSNEPIRAFHPALTRAGRCAAQVQFKPLSIREAEEWLGRHAPFARRSVQKPITIAELHALRDGRRTTPKRPVGFASS